MQHKYIYKYPYKAIANFTQFFSLAIVPLQEMVLRDHIT